MITPRLFLLLTKYKHMKFEKGVKMNLDDIKMPKLFRTIKRKMSYKSHNCKECNLKRLDGVNEPLLVDHIWCETCSPIQLQREFILWKSGNNEIDDFIRFQQIKAKTPSNLIEWIPYDRFIDIKCLEQGGFSKVYSATWMDGPIQGWNLEQKQWNRLSKTKVALKVLKDSQNISSEFLEELHLNLQRGSTYVVKCLGFTQEPKSKDYAMVLEFAENGNLRHYLNCNSNSIDWYQKIEILKQIGHHLYKLHEKKIIHKNFHIGNILYANHIDDLIIISDLGICQPVSKTACLPQKEIYGVLPYVAPEVLREKSYSKASDIYAFGGIIYEIITGNPPFHDRSHDFQLALDICNGVHPTIPEETPKSVVNLLKRCWEPDPKKRITAIEIFSMIRCCFIYEDECKISHRISQEIEQCKCIHQTHPTEQTKIHPEANYHSRLLSFPKLEETLASGI